MYHEIGSSTVGDSSALVFNLPTCCRAVQGSGEGPESPQSLGVIMHRLI